MAKKAYVRRTAKALKRGVEDAERYRSVANRPVDGIVNIKPTQIKTRPELFQMREFSFGLRDTDGEHVKKLARAISVVGELDPPVVIKIGADWICIDGHHRLEAYKKAGWRGPIRCMWFAGTVREAADEAIQLNTKDRLNVTQQARLEAAWKLVIIGDHSKAEIVKLCGVGEGSVAHMRRIKAVYSTKSDVGAKLFRERLAMPLDEASWNHARLTYAGVEPKARNDEEEAAKLARRINSRLTNLLSRNPAITARALEIYDPKLPRALTQAWENGDRRLAAGEDDELVSASKKMSPLPKGWKAGDPLPDL